MLSGSDTPPLPGLAIDFPESKLYWISSKNHTINRCNLDGSGLEVIDAMRNQLGKATALAIMGEGHWVGAGTRAEQVGRTGQETGLAWGRGLLQSLIPSCHHRGQAVVGRSGVREDGHVQQG